MKNISEPAMPETRQRENKRIAIMQPYFFPYPGYIGLIKHTDEFVLFDTVQFVRHGWIARNRILKPDDGWMYIRVPLCGHSMKIKIKDVAINNRENWQDRILAQLQHYRKKAPFYHRTTEVVRAAFDEKTDSIVRLNFNALQAVCAYLHIPFRASVFSETNLPITPPSAPDEWALNICLATGYREYWNSPGGMRFFDASKYRRAGIKLVFHQAVPTPYPQGRESGYFEPGLSIIDAMMFNSPEQIRQMLDRYEACDA
ncbi:MAG: WbqC family protein [Tannerella sp.]|nr:WbqC family protein [Tannerella sp.]